MDEQTLKKLLMENLKSRTDEELSDIFIHALNLNPKQVKLVNFVFWFCYMVETDLDKALKVISRHSDTLFPPEVNEFAKKIIADGLKGYGETGMEIETLLTEMAIKMEDIDKISTFLKKNYLKKRPFTGIEDLPFFIDKIRVYEFLVGKNNHVKLLYKINNIRNDLSHGRIDTLTYNKQSLFLRTTKEALVEDYFEAIFEGDLTKSPIWNSLTPEQIIEIEKMKKDHPYPSPKI